MAEWEHLASKIVTLACPAAVSPVGLCCFSFRRDVRFPPCAEPKVMHEKPNSTRATLRMTNRINPQQEPTPHPDQLSLPLPSGSRTTTAGL